MSPWRLTFTMLATVAHFAVTSANVIAIAGLGVVSGTTEHPAA
jgi:hypothetical protein